MRRTSARRSFKLKSSGNYLAAQRGFTSSTPEPTFAAAEKYLVDLRAESEASYAELSRLQASATTLGVTLSVIAILFGLVIATLLSRAISRSVGAATLAISGIVSEDIASLTLVLKRLAGGDLTGRFASSRDSLKVSGTDEIGALVTTYNALAAALGEMANQYTTATDNLRDLISGVAMTSKSLAAASDEASAAAKQSATAVEGSRENSDYIAR